jgi:hypothetical protein
MEQLLISHPWLVVIVLVAIVIVSCTAIVFVTEYLQKTHKLEVEAALKQEMLNRGLSAADIKTVLEASSDAEELKAALANQGIHLGLGKFKLEMGAIRDGAKT